MTFFSTRDPRVQIFDTHISVSRTCADVSRIGTGSTTLRSVYCDGTAGRQSWGGISRGLACGDWFVIEYAEQAANLHGGLVGGAPALRPFSCVCRLRMTKRPRCSGLSRRRDSNRDLSARTLRATKRLVPMSDDQYSTA